MKAYKDILKKLKLTNNDIAKMFGYKNTKSFTGSSAYPAMQSGIVQLYRTINSDPHNNHPPAA